MEEHVDARMRVCWMEEEWRRLEKEWRSSLKLGCKCGG